MGSLPPPRPGGRELVNDTEQQFSQAYPDPDQHPPPDVEMAGSDAAPLPEHLTARPSAPACRYISNQQHRPNPPAPPAQGPARRHDSFSPASTAAAGHRRHYSYGSSATASPAAGPQAGGYSSSYAPSDRHHSASGSGSALTSPALGPLDQRDLDQEATAALLMLNVDRRGTVASTSAGTNAGGGGGTARGISVRDLLSA